MDQISLNVIWIRLFLSSNLFPSLIFLKIFFFHSFLCSFQNSILTNSQVWWRSINIFLNKYIPLIIINCICRHSRNTAFAFVWLVQYFYVRTHSMCILWCFWIRTSLRQNFSSWPVQNFVCWGMEAEKCGQAFDNRQKWAPARGSFYKT